MTHETIVYEGVNAPSPNVLADGETVRLTQAQMCQLFGRDQPVIARHIGNVFKEGGLESESAYAEFVYTASDGKTYQVGYYNPEPFYDENRRMIGFTSEGGAK